MGHHDHAGAVGAFSGLFGYIAGLFLEITPMPSHLFQGIFTAICCAAAGWCTTEILKNYIKPRFVRFIKQRKK